MIFDSSDRTFFLTRQFTFDFKLLCVFEARRKLEDKLEGHRIEWRSFFLPMDLQSVHHNRDMPAGFSLYLCVADTTLPSKGTAYRANRSAGKAGFSKCILFPFLSFPVNFKILKLMTRFLTCLVLCIT